MSRVLDRESCGGQAPVDSRWQVVNLMKLMFKHNKISPEVLERHQPASFRCFHPAMAFGVCPDYLVR